MPKLSTSIKLGESYRDRVTGFEGIATGATFWENGCVRVVLERGDKDGKPEDQVFDEQRLVPAAQVKAGPGGDRAQPRQAEIPR